MKYLFFVANMSLTGDLQIPEHNEFQIWCILHRLLQFFPHEFVDEMEVVMHRCSGFYRM
jgi:hypothetical protein